MIHCEGKESTRPITLCPRMYPSSEHHECNEGRDEKSAAEEPPPFRTMWCRKNMDCKENVQHQEPWTGMYKQDNRQWDFRVANALLFNCHPDQVYPSNSSVPNKEECHEPHNRCNIIFHVALTTSLSRRFLRSAGVSCYK